LGRERRRKGKGPKGKREGGETYNNNTIYFTYLDHIFGFLVFFFGLEKPKNELLNFLFLKSYLNLLKSLSQY